MVINMERQKRECAVRKSKISPQIQRPGGRRKKTEAAFTIFTSNKTLQRTILIAQVKAMDGRGIPQGRVGKKERD